MVFTLVNKRWRDVAVSYAPLWDWEIQLPTRLGAALAKPFQLYCKLSGNASQCSMIFTYTGSTVTDLHLFNFYANLLAKIPGGLLPSLESLTLKTLSWSPDHPPQVMHALENALNLRKLNVPREFLEIADRGLLSLQWTQITHLQVYHETFSCDRFPLEKCLAWCSNLESLIFDLSPLDTGSTVAPNSLPDTHLSPPLSLPKLSSLIIGFYVIGAHVPEVLDHAILQSMNLPDLSTFTLLTSKDARPPSGPQFESGLRSALMITDRQSHGIDSLGVDFRIQSTEDVSTLLQLLDATAPRALKLSVHNEDTFLISRMLSQYISSTPEAPSGLKYLTLRWGRDGDSWATDIEHFLESQ